MDINRNTENKEQKDVPLLLVVRTRSAIFNFSFSLRNMLT